MFVFNNVKSNIKNTFYQPTKAKSNTKNVIFTPFIPIPKAPIGRGWADIYTYKA